MAKGSPDSNGPDGSGGGRDVEYELDVHVFEAPPIPVLLPRRA